jgi:hypothetical protein
VYAARLRSHQSRGKGSSDSKPVRAAVSEKAVKVQLRNEEAVDLAATAIGTRLFLPCSYPLFLAAGFTQRLRGSSHFTLGPMAHISVYLGLRLGDTFLGFLATLSWASWRHFLGLLGDTFSGYFATFLDNKPVVSLLK